MPTHPDSATPTPPHDPRPSRFADDWAAAVIVRPEHQLPATDETAPTDAPDPRS